jgi:hypothetical protein
MAPETPVWLACSRVGRVCDVLDQQHDATVHDRIIDVGCIEYFLGAALLDGRFARLDAT